MFNWFNPRVTSLAASVDAEVDVGRWRLATSALSKAISTLQSAFTAASSDRSNSTWPARWSISWDDPFDLNGWYRPPLKLRRDPRPKDEAAGSCCAGWTRHTCGCGCCCCCCCCICKWTSCCNNWFWCWSVPGSTVLLPVPASGSFERLFDMICRINENEQLLVTIIDKIKYSQSQLSWYLLGIVASSFDEQGEMKWIWNKPELA